MKPKDLLQSGKKYIALSRELLGDPETPLISKILLGAAVGYFVLPFDIIPDFIPILGSLDDIIIVPGLLYIALKFIPNKIIQKHKDAIFGMQDKR